MAEPHTIPSSIKHAVCCLLRAVCLSVSACEKVLAVISYWKINMLQNLKIFCKMEGLFSSSKSNILLSGKFCTALEPHGLVLRMLILNQLSWVAAVNKPLRCFFCCRRWEVIGSAHTLQWSCSSRVKQSELHANFSDLRLTACYQTRPENFCMSVQDYFL